MELARALKRLRTDFVKAHTEKWGAILASIGAGVAFVMLLVVLYLFTDLMVWKGLIPGFEPLAAANQAEFADDWGKRWPESDRAEALRQVGVPELTAKKLAADIDTKNPPQWWEWETRWRGGVYLVLRDRVSASAADEYAAGLKLKSEDVPIVPRYGVLSLVVRDRNRWSGHVLGWLASWNPWMWRPGADHDANMKYLIGLTVLAFLIAFVRGLLLNVTSYLAAAVTLDTMLRLRRAIYFHTYRLGSLAVRTAGIAEPVELFTRRVEAIADAVHAWLLYSYRLPVQFLMLLVLVLLIQFWLGIAFLLLALLVWVVAGQVAAHFRAEGRHAARQANALLAQLQESMSIIRLVKCFQMERFNQNRVERQLAESGRANWRRRRGDALSRPLLASVAAVASVALLALAGRAVLSGDFSVAGLVILVTAIASMYRPIEGWLESRHVLRNGREAAAAVFEFLDRKGEAAEAADAEFLPALTTRIEFRQVVLKAPGTGRNILENISFAIPAGSKVAIVGPDEDEKRALVYLIPRFLDPTHGEVRIEDKNVRWVTHESLRAQVAVVMQADLVFGDSVLNNIGTGDTSYSLPQIIEAAKVAHAHQFIERLPYGYETLIGDQGYSLRPGERFRIALARAILRDPSVLIIEEPFGPIDDDTLALLDDTLDRIANGRTIIFIAHRVTTLRTVDRVFLLRGGHLEAAGHHRDLWKESESYRRLPLLADAAVESV